ncbi:hypothetical protein TIFTF001_017203 [Ficus carica]|uniref:Uncharacterized protein n=1 Tax=Ficus carica TaxID=3494 RepID=A0AA88A1Q6_FICCA|nr:hypothetical protein TIFTF001_017203 [Ficus carica]
MEQPKDLVTETEKMEHWDRWRFQADDGTISSNFMRFPPRARDSFGHKDRCFMASHRDILRFVSFHCDLLQIAISTARSVATSPGIAISSTRSDTTSRLKIATPARFWFMSPS